MSSSAMSTQRMMSSTDTVSSPLQSPGQRLGTQEDVAVGVNVGPEYPQPGAGFGPGVHVLLGVGVAVGVNVGPEYPQPGAGFGPGVQVFLGVGVAVAVAAVSTASR